MHLLSVGFSGLTLVFAVCVMAAMAESGRLAYRGGRMRGGAEPVSARHADQTSRGAWHRDRQCCYEGSRCDGPRERAESSRDGITKQLNP
jgi:hypothetical protein